MVVDNLLGRGTLTVEQSVSLAISCGARISGGTDMAALSRAAAKKFTLTSSTTNDIKFVLYVLRQCPIIIANVGGDRAGYKGVFLYGGHSFVLWQSIFDRVVSLEPSVYDSKFTCQLRLALPSVY